MIDNPWTRRQFMRIGAGTLAAGAAAKVTLLEPSALWASATQLQPSDTVHFASIGTGVRGCELLKASLRVPGAECVAVCDLWEGRLTAGQEAVKKTVATTRNYKEVLDRKDVDAVIVAVTDHQHRRVVVDACAAGKDVYCEKPLSHTVDDGFAMIAAAQKYNRILQVGSQRVSSILYEKARQIYASGALGDVCNIDAYWDRNSASGAWVYPIPPGANDQNIDWTAFLTGAPNVPFDPVRFFRWRCFTDYGEGLAGDLFVHLISGIQFITGTNMVASRAQSSGGLFRWKDGRQFPDLIETMYDYPNFRVAVRCNLNNDGGEFIGFYGTKGTLIIKDATLTYTPQDTRPQAEGYSVVGWPADLRKQYLAQWEQEHPLPAPFVSKLTEGVETYVPPPGYSDVVDHQANFFNAVRTRKPCVENEVFGNNAAIGCHLANYAYFNKKIATWDAAAKKITG
ncbi:MAG TPA: Gfo/Idh/MocA family oxidoreductase [Terriglobales bacterium]